MGTAERLKTLYPEIDLASGPVTKPGSTGVCRTSRTAGSHRNVMNVFPDYIIHLLLENMRAGDSAKRKKGQTLSLSERLDRLFAGEEQESAECH
jgi:hypothetical protein